MGIGSGKKTGCSYGDVLFTEQTGCEVAPDKHWIFNSRW